MKTCTKCRQEKDESLFYTSKAKTKSGVKVYIKGMCIECDLKEQKERWRRDPEKSREMRRKYQQRPYRKINKRKSDLKKSYGMTLEDYDRMLKEQNGVCKICGADRPNATHKNFHIDHCHETGEVRGLLCSSCNNGIGRFKHSVDLLIKAADYLR